MNTQRPFGNRHLILFLMVFPFLALAALIAGLFSKPVARTKLEIAATIDSFIDGNCGPHDWDNFLRGGRIENTELDEIRRRCLGLAEEFPPEEKGHYCSEAGVTIMRNYVNQLRSHA